VIARAESAIRLEEDAEARKSNTGADRSGRRNNSSDRGNDRYKPYGRPVTQVSKEWTKDPNLPPKISEYGFAGGVQGLMKAFKDLGDKIRWPRPMMESQGFKRDPSKNVSFTMT